MLNVSNFIISVIMSIALHGILVNIGHRDVIRKISIAGHAKAGKFPACSFYQAV